MQLKKNKTGMGNIDQMDDSLSCRCRKTADGVSLDVNSIFWPLKWKHII